jgi:predicted nucleic acid-binding Zn ribbon protein
VGEILEGLTRKSKLGAQLDQARIWENWAQIVGPRSAPHCQPETVKKDVLHVVAESAVWMNRISYAKWDIISNINDLVGKELISDLFIRLVPDENPPNSQDSE